MNIGIIGAGAMAQAISKHAIKAGHTVMLSNSRGPNSIARLAKMLGCLAGTSNEAAEFGEIIIIATPLGVYKQLPPAIFVGKVVLDLLNYFPHRDGNIPELQSGETTTSELLSMHLSGARLVKAFNAITVEDLERGVHPFGTSDHRALPIAGDDPEAKAIAAHLINEFGFDVVDGGLLADSWRFERFRPAYCVALHKEALKETLASTSRDTKVPDGYWLYRR